MKHKNKKSEKNNYIMIIIILFFIAICSLWTIDISTTAMVNNMELHNLAGFSNASTIYHLGLIANSFAFILMTFILIKSKD